MMKADAKPCGTAVSTNTFLPSRFGYISLGHGCDQGQSWHRPGTQDGAGETRTASTRNRVKKARLQLQNLIKAQQQSACCQQRKQTGETRRAAEGLGNLLPACTKADRRGKNPVIPQPEVNYKTHPSRAQGEALDQTSDAGM